MDFEKITFGYSSKNIPIPSKSSYLKVMINKLESFVKRLRWRAFFFERGSTDTDASISDNYGFKSEKTPPQNDGLSAFETDLYHMVKNIKFRKVRNQFQNQLIKDMKEIKSSNKMVIPADKSTNFYKVSTEHYKKLLSDNISAKYQKNSGTTIDEINQEAKQIAQSLKLEDRIDSFPRRNAFIHNP